MKLFADDRLVALLAVLITLTVCFTRLSMAAGQFFQVLALLAGICLFVRQRDAVEISPESKKYYGAALLFFAATAVSAIGAYNPGRVLKEAANMWLWRSVIFVLIAAFIHRRDYLENMLAAFLAVLSIDGFVALAQVLFFGVSRGAGFGNTKLSFAGTIAMFFPVALVILLDPSFGKRLKKSALFCLPGMLAGLTASQSRAAFLICLAVILFLCFVYARKSGKYLLIFLSVIAIFFGAVAANPKYINRLEKMQQVTDHAHRIWLWKSAAKMFRDHPVKGVGLGNFKYYYRYKNYMYHKGKMEPIQRRYAIRYEKEKAKKMHRKPVYTRKHLRRIIRKDKAFDLYASSHAHNSYFQLLAETGVIGFAGLVLMALFYLGSSFWNWFKTKNPYDLMFFTSFLSFFVLFAQIEHVIDNSASMRTMWFLLAILLQLKAASVCDNGGETAGER